MTHPDCIRLAKELYNYTVEDIDVRMHVLHALMTEERLSCKLAGECPTVIPSVHAYTECVDGWVRANDQAWECGKINLHAFVSLSDLGSPAPADGNDIWGYSAAGRNYAITGQTDGASIVDVTSPSAPEVLCFIPSKVNTPTIWRDIKVVHNYAYIVADRTNQGLQWINLDTAIAKCRDSGSRPLRLVENTDFGWTGDVFDNGMNVHNIVANEDEEEVYIVGSRSCSGGLLTVDVSNVNLNSPPVRTGCYAQDGYTHDAECVDYDGPDTRYTGDNICFGYNEDSITIVDMSTPDGATMLSRTTYSGSRYTHQGWITEDHTHLLMNDELDESGGTVNSQTTYIIDITSLTTPSLVPWNSGLNTIDHNNYIKGGYVYQANYKSGLRVLKLDLTNFNNQDKLVEVCFFKTYHGDMNYAFDGAWSVYPFYPVGNDERSFVVVQDINTGLYVLDVTDCFVD